MITDASAVAEAPGSLPPDASRCAGVGRLTDPREITRLVPDLAGHDLSNPLLHFYRFFDHGVFLILPREHGLEMHTEFCEDVDMGRAVNDFGCFKSQLAHDFPGQEWIYTPVAEVDRIKRRRIMFAARAFGFGLVASEGTNLIYRQPL